MKYALSDIYTAIQGEGANTGVPMIIVRMMGCSVACWFCDTKQTWSQGNRPKQFKKENITEALGDGPEWCEVSAEDVVAFVRDNCPGPTWTLITGGEPAEQDLTELSKAFHAQGYKLALETSGTAYLFGKFDWVCVSPKYANIKGLSIGSSIMERADEIKFIVGREADIEQIDYFLKDYQVSNISLQPMSVNRKATELCQKICMERGWRLSLQTHKYLQAR